MRIRLLAVSLLLALSISASSPNGCFRLGSGRISWYDDTGNKTGCAWHKVDCGLPSRVNQVDFAAAANRWIPCCTRLLVCRGNVCAMVTKVDALGRTYESPRVDLWPAPAKVLGLYQKDGVSTADIYICTGSSRPVVTGINATNTPQGTPPDIPGWIDAGREPPEH